MSKVKTGFVAMVIAALKGGDEAKLNRFHSKTVKELKNQIRLRNLEIEENLEKIVDLQEEYDNALINIDFDAISTTEKANEYTEVYLDKMFRYEERLIDLSDINHDLSEAIDKYESMIEKLGNA